MCHRFVWNGECRGFSSTHVVTLLQGIDIKDIELVIQWKVTCNPCILWQRFGRAARDKQVQGTALLFVESKDCDRVEGTNTRKRKAPESEVDKVRPQQKKAKKTAKPTPMVLAAGEDMEVGFWEARAAIYHEHIDNGKRETNPVLDDAINAGVRGIGCRRKPFHVYFENNNLCGSSTASLNCTLLTGCRRSHL